MSSDQPDISSEIGTIVTMTQNIRDSIRMCRFLMGLRQPAGEVPRAAAACEWTWPVKRVTLIG